MWNAFSILTILVTTLTLSNCSRPVDRPPSQSPKPQKPAELKAVHRISFSDMLDPEVGGHCTADAIGPHALLTAGHCLKNYNKITLDQDSKPMVILQILLDGNDHVIFIVNRSLTDWLPLQQRSLTEYEPVHMWGSPKDLDQVYRVGYFKTTEPVFGLTCLRFVLPVYPGDSGAGIIDESGKIVAVVTASHGASEISPPLAFTLGQLQQASL